MKDQESEKFYEQPPFPPLKIETNSLKGVDFFASWQGFQANDKVSDGNIGVFVDVTEAADKKPSAAQTNAYQFLKENEAQITAALLAGLLADYPQIRAVYDGIEEEYLPNVESAEDFRWAIKPFAVHIVAESDGVFTYVGFEFDCLWDEEHGLGVMMHRDKYVGCNDAEAAWNLDLAQS